MEWDSPAIIVDVRPFNDADAIAVVISESHGWHRGLVRGGLSRGKIATWQTGNLAHIRWTGRDTETLGAFTAELVHPTAALAMQDGLALAMLSAACAVAHGALPQHEAHPRSFQGLLRLLAGLDADSLPAQTLPAYIHWEADLLAELGYGLDLTCCALTGVQQNLKWVSPRTGRAVTDEAVGEWRARMLPLPAFLLGDAPSGPQDWLDGLRLTAHFLARDAFGHRHQPVPAARHMLYDRVAALHRAQMHTDDHTQDRTQDRG